MKLYATRTAVAGLEAAENRDELPRAVVFHSAGDAQMVPRGLTFELSRARRQAPLGRGRKMYSVPWSGQAVPAVARRLERRVRPHSP